MGYGGTILIPRSPHGECVNDYYKDFNRSVIYNSNITFNKHVNIFILEGKVIETVSTTAPAVALIFIATLFLRLLYLIQDS
jgi:hypothetical protein